MSHNTASIASILKIRLLLDSFQFIWISPDKGTKQSRDLSVCLCYSLLNINNTSKQKGCFQFVSRESCQCSKNDVLRVY